MRGDVIFCIYGVHAGREKDSYFGCSRSFQEASAKVEVLDAREMDGESWARRYHNKGFVIREVVVDSDFEIPPRPAPRQRFCIDTTAKPNQPGTWDSSIVEVFDRGITGADLESICTYERNHSMYQTFEPFRQAGRNFALISRDYTRTAVLDLASGAVIAEEEQSGSAGSGFCPIGFYVPDWWDLYDDSVLPGSEDWRAEREWPAGDCGFVWGCEWGDDSSWKVQYLDLSRIQQGIIRRDERFGYVELATFAYDNPCLTLQQPAPTGRTVPPFIRLSIGGGVSSVTFAVDMRFDLASGTPCEWQRLKIANME